LEFRRVLFRSLRGQSVGGHWKIWTPGLPRNLTEPVLHSPCFAMVLRFGGGWLSHRDISLSLIQRFGSPHFSQASLSLHGPRFPEPDPGNHSRHRRIFDLALLTDSHSCPKKPRRTSGGAGRYECGSMVQLARPWLRLRTFSE